MSVHCFAFAHTFTNVLYTDCTPQQPLPSPTAVPLSLTCDCTELIVCTVVGIHIRLAIFAAYRRKETFCPPAVGRVPLTCNMSVRAIAVQNGVRRSPAGCLNGFHLRLYLSTATRSRITPPHTSNVSAKTTGYIFAGHLLACIPQGTFCPPAVEKGSIGPAWNISLGATTC